MDSILGILNSFSGVPSAKMIKVVLLAVGAILLLIFFFFFGSNFLKNSALLGPTSTSSSRPEQPTDTVQISKSAPDSVGKGEEISYKIDVIFKGAGRANIKVTDTLPTDTSFVNGLSNPSGKVPCQGSITGDRIGNTVTWTLSNVEANQPQTVCLTIKAPDKDIWISNTATAEVLSTSDGNANLGLVVKGPNSVPDINTTITYTIQATYRGSGNIIFDLTDKLPDLTSAPNTSSYQSPGSDCSTSVTGSYDASSNTVSWPGLKLNKGETVNLCLTVKPTADADGKRLVNIAKAKIIQINNPVTALPPSDNDCGGKYSQGSYPIQNNKIHKNFGDPGCNYTKEGLAELLKATDPKEAAFWFWLVEYESSYIPNAFNYAPDVPNDAGAWGLFQMGPSVNGAGVDGNGQGGPYDRGDVNWQVQTTNAVNHKNYRESQGVGFHSEQSYWDVARPSYCVKYPDRCAKQIK